MIQNIVIDKLLVEPESLFALNKEDWENVEKPITMFTEERFLPKLMVEAGLVKSISEVRRNQPKLMVTLDKVDYLEIKWGKKRLFIGVVYVFKRSDSKYVIRILNKYDDSVALNYEYIASLDGVMDKCALHCNNVNCPHYKSSLGKVYNDSAKEVFCSLEDLRKCGQCEKANVIHPFIVSELFNGIAYTMKYREVNATESKNRDEPERIDDVIVYFGGASKHKPLPFLKVSDMKVEKVFPDSHASPREHY